MLRTCIVNFRTTLEDIDAVPGIVLRLGRELDVTIRPAELQDWKPQTEKIGEHLGHLF